MFETNNNPPREMRGRGSKGKYEKVKEIKESKGRKEGKKEWSTAVLLSCLSESNPLWPEFSVGR